MRATTSRDPASLTSVPAGQVADVRTAYPIAGFLACESS